MNVSFENVSGSDVRFQSAVSQEGDTQIIHIIASQHGEDTMNDQASDSAAPKEEENSSGSSASRPTGLMPADLEAIREMIIDDLRRNGPIACAVRNRVLRP